MATLLFFHSLPKCSQCTKTRSCNSGASGKKLRSQQSRAGALPSYGKAAPLQQHFQRGEGGGQALLAVAQAAPSARVTEHPAGVRTAINVLLTITPGSVTDPPPGATMGNSWDGSPGARDSPELALLESPQSFSLEEQEAVPVRLHFVTAQNDKMLPERCVTIAVPSVHGFIFLCPR